MKRKLALALATLTLAGTAFAQAKPEDQIKWRQSGYGFMGWNMARIKANLEGQFNKEEVVKAANAIQAIANSGMGALFAPGTEKGAGWKETRVKPELFADKEGVTKVATNFNREANELAKVAAGGDPGAIKAQFGKLGEACKACHEKYRKDDK